LLTNIPADGETPDWDAVARDYAAGLLTVSEICARHGVSRATLYNRAKIEGWPLRHGATVIVQRRTQAGLTKRLLAALDTKMKQFESRMSESAGGETAADGERDARTLNTLVRLFEKLKEIGEVSGGEAAARSPNAMPGPAIGLKPDDAERLRNDLAQRLESLRGQLGG
jgi:hypothetical protein